jgi:hypothetical protein
MKVIFGNRFSVNEIIRVYGTCQKLLFSLESGTGCFGNEFGFFSTAISPLSYNNLAEVRLSLKYILNSISLAPHTKRNRNSYKKLHGLSPRANYTDRATAACRRSDCQLFADRECHVVSLTDPYGRILCFLFRSRYFSIN